jgi:tetratricopeptide (TPR) repeat protein
MDMASTSTLKSSNPGTFILILLVLCVGTVASAFAATVFAQYQVSAWENLRLAYESAYINGNYELAEVCAEKALDQVTKFAGGDIPIALTKEDLANTFLAQAKYLQAADYFSQALKAFQQNRESWGNQFDAALILQHTLICYRGIIDSLISAEKFDQAESQCELALAYIHNLKPSDYTIEAPANVANHIAIVLALADLRTKKHDMEGAEQLCRIASALTQTCTLPYALLNQYHLTYANVLELMGKPQQSKRLLQKTAWLDVLNLTVDAIKNNNQVDAERYLKLTLEEAQRLGTASDTTAITYEKLGEVYTEQKKMAQAEQAYSSAIRYRMRSGESTDSAMIVSDLCQLEATYMTMGNYAQVLLTADTLLKLNTEVPYFNQTEILSDLAQAQQRLGNRALAISAINRALALNEHPQAHKRAIVRRLLIMADLCTVMHERPLEKAVLDKAKAYSDFWKLPADRIRKRLLKKIAQWYEKEGKPVEAEQTMRQANAIMAGAGKE